MNAQLAPNEDRAFSVLAGILIEREQVERDALRVSVASKGCTIGREYMRLRELGLIEEFTIRPSFLRRLFGAKPSLLVRLTEEGRNLASPTLDREPATTGPLVALELDADQVPQEITVEQQTVAVEAPTLQQEDTASTTQGIDPEAVPEPVASAEANLADAASKYPPPKRFALTDYTDVIGGQAEDSSFALDGSERLDGLAELLGLMGIEMTPAGNLLAANRWTEGYTDADVALEVIVSSVAHAARLDQTGTARLDQSAMMACLESVESTMSSLVSEGHLTAAQLTESLQAMRGFIQADDRAVDAINELLSDPLRGMAPPAMCPEEVWVATDEEEEG